MKRLMRTLRIRLWRKPIVWLILSFAFHAGVEPSEIARQVVQGIQNTYMGNYGDETMEAIEELLCNEFDISVEVADFGVLVVTIADAR